VPLPGRERSGSGCSVAAGAELRLGAHRRPGSAALQAGVCVVMLKAPYRLGGRCRRNLYRLGHYRQSRRGSCLQGSIGAFESRKGRARRDRADSVGSRPGSRGSPRPSGAFRPRLDDRHNTLLEKKGAKVGLLITEGFRDSLEIAVPSARTSGIIASLSRRSGSTLPAATRDGADRGRRQASGFRSISRAWRVPPKSSRRRVCRLSRSACCTPMPTPRTRGPSSRSLPAFCLTSDHGLA